MRKMRVLSDESARVLALFLDAPDTVSWGRQILLRTEIRSGSLYPILHRFESQGLLVSAWEEFDVAVANGRRPRKLYRLNQHNLDEARSIYHEWQATHDRKRTSTIERPALA